jgi:hypothetical protein
MGDNATTFFRSTLFRQLMAEWNVASVPTSAYRSQGNGIAERIHRTIKRMAARSGKSIELMVFWYNNTKNDASGLIPFEVVFGALSKLPGVRDTRVNLTDLSDKRSNKCEPDNYKNCEKNPFKVGDGVFLKSGKNCTTPWKGPKQVTRIVSNVSVELDFDGVARHVSFLHKFPQQLKACPKGHIKKVPNSIVCTRTTMKKLRSRLRIVQTVMKKLRSRLLIFQTVMTRAMKRRILRFLMVLKSPWKSCSNRSRSDRGE